MPNILVVDDDTAVNEVLVNMVTKLGYVPFSAHSLLEGTAKAERDDMNLILLDIKSKKLPLILKRDDIIGTSPNMNLALERIAQAGGYSQNKPRGKILG